MKRSEVIAELEGMLIEYRAETIRYLEAIDSFSLYPMDDLQNGIEILSEAIRYLEESERLGVDS